MWFSAYWSRLFLCFWVSSGVRLENRAWNPSVFSTRLTVQTETSVPAVTKSCCRCFSVTQGFLTTCLCRNLVAAANPKASSLCLLLLPSTLNLRTMLPTVSLWTFSAFGLFLYPFPCLFKVMISSLNFLDNYFDHISNITQQNPSQSRYLCVLSYAHLN